MTKIRYELRIIWCDGSSSPWPQSKEGESLRDYLASILARELPCKEQPAKNCPKCGRSTQEDC